MAYNLSESRSATTKAEHDIQRLRLFKVVPLVCSYLGKANSRRFGKPVNYWGIRIPFCPAMRHSPAFTIDHHDATLQGRRRRTVLDPQGQTVHSCAETNAVHRRRRPAGKGVLGGAIAAHPA